MQADCTHFNDVVYLAANLHRSTLCRLAAGSSSPLQGCSEGAVKCKMSSRWRRRRREIEIVAGWVRKLNPHKVQQLLLELDDEFAKGTADTNAAHDAGAPRASADTSMLSAPPLAPAAAGAAAEYGGVEAGGGVADGTLQSGTGACFGEVGNSSPSCAGGMSGGLPLLSHIGSNALQMNGCGSLPLDGWRVRRFSTAVRTGTSWVGKFR